MTYETIEDAFYFVSSAPPGDHVAVLCLRSGTLYCASDLAGHDAMPDDLEERDDYLEIPHRSDLGLGQPPATEFVALRCPEHLERVRGILSRPGGSSLYKTFLAQKGLLEEWYLFETERGRKALLEWCQDKGIPLKNRSSMHS